MFSRKPVNFKLLLFAKKIKFSLILILNKYYQSYFINFICLFFGGEMWYLVAVFRKYSLNKRYKFEGDIYYISSNYRGPLTPLRHMI